MHTADDELPEDEEEILVYVEFDGSVASSSLNNENLQLDMIGLDMEHPIMRINGKFYEGTYGNAVGTYMFFEGDDNPQVDDPVFDAKPTLKYVAKTRKVLKMSRIFAQLKTELLGDSNDPECVPSMEVIEKSGIPPVYREEALKSWEKMRDDRMKALNDYLEKQRIRDEKRSQGIEPDSASDDENPFAIYKPKTVHTNIEKPDDSTNISSQENTRSVLNVETKCKGPGVDKRIIVSKADVSSVIDPQPSTSKSCEPSNIPEVESPAASFSNLESDEDESDLSNFKGMHKARVLVTNKSKVRKFSNPSRKKPKKPMQSSVHTGDAAASNSINKNSDGNSGKIVKTNRDPRTEKRMVITEANQKVIQKKPMEMLENIKDLSISQPTVESVNNVNEEITKDSKEPDCTLDRRKLEKQRRREEKMRNLANQLKKAADERRQKNERLEDE